MFLVLFLVLPSYIYWLSYRLEFVILNLYCIPGPPEARHFWEIWHLLLLSKLASHVLHITEVAPALTFFLTDLAQWTNWGANSLKTTPSIDMALVALYLSQATEMTCIWRNQTTPSPRSHYTCLLTGTTKPSTAVSLPWVDSGQITRHKSIIDTVRQVSSMRIADNKQKHRNGTMAICTNWTATRLRGKHVLLLWSTSHWYCQSSTTRTSGGEGRQLKRIDPLLGVGWGCSSGYLPGPTDWAGWEWAGRGWRRSF